MTDQDDRWALRAAAALKRRRAALARDAVQALKDRPRDSSYRAPRVAYPCAHCGYRTLRLARAWVHSYGHGYRRAAEAA